MTISITVKLYGGLQKHAPGQGNEFEMALDAAETLGDVLVRLSISQKDCVSLVNGRRADLSKDLVEGDTLVLFPPIAGG